MTRICRRLIVRAGRGKRSVLTIELTRGSGWREPAETIDRRECDTHSIEFAAAEALHWLVETQKSAPGRGVTHYRVIREDGTVIGGPS